MADAEARQDTEGPARAHAGQGSARLHPGPSADFGPQALEPGWVTNRQIEAARRVAGAHRLKRGASLHPHLPDKAGDEEARGDALARQGQPEVLGRRGQAGRSFVR